MANLQNILCDKEKGIFELAFRYYSPQIAQINTDYAFYSLSVKIRVISGEIKV